MKRNRTFTCLFLGVALLVSASSEFSAQAQPRKPAVFEWYTYTKNDKKYEYPEWVTDAADNTKANLSNAVGVVYPPRGYKVTKSVLKVYKPAAGAPGTYEPMPTLTIESNNPLALVPDGYQVAWGDNGTPKKPFTKGSTLKLEIRNTYENKNNANDKFESDVPTLYSTVSVP